MRMQTSLPLRPPQKSTPTAASPSISHASQYAIVIDTHSHAAVDVSDLFIDIARDAWYKDAVQYAYDNGLMTGVSATEFDPEATTTRAMIVSILARLENVTTAEAAGFADVDDNEWYATAVNWAANVGVVNGYEDNTFQPNTAITREQLAAILCNYAQYKGFDTTPAATSAPTATPPASATGHRNLSNGWLAVVCSVATTTILCVHRAPQPEQKWRVCSSVPLETLQAINKPAPPSIGRRSATALLSMTAIRALFLLMRAQKKEPSLV